MKNLYLFCSAGMSSSVIAKKMQDLANEKNINVKISYFPESKIDEKSTEADLILLSPQIRYREPDIKKNYPNKPYYVIDMIDYGMLKADNILDKCLKLI